MITNNETLDYLLESCNPKVVQFIKEMNSINAELQKQIIKLEAKNKSQHNKITGLQEELVQALAAAEANQPSLKIVLQNSDGSQSEVDN